MGGQVRCHWSQSRLKSVKLGGETEIGGYFSGLEMILVWKRTLTVKIEEDSFKS